MRVRMKTILAGPQGTAQAGAIIDVSQTTGETLIAAGYAALVDAAPPAVEPPPVIETTALAQPETRSGARRRFGRSGA